MSHRLAQLAKGKKLSRKALLALQPPIVYNDGRTKQAYKDECDISKIMARFAVTDTFTHLNKYEATYSDFSDYDFTEATNKLTQGREIFDDLPAETRREFGQSPAAFFAYVNDPANKDDLHTKIPGLAKPGTQLPNVAPHATSEPIASDPRSPEPEPARTTET